MTNPTERTSTNILGLLNKYATEGSRGGHWFYDTLSNDYDWVGYDQLAKQVLDIVDHLQAGEQLTNKLLPIVASKPQFTTAMFYVACAVGATPLVVPPPKALKGSDAWRRRLGQALATSNAAIIVADTPQDRAAFDDMPGLTPIYCSVDSEGVTPLIDHASAFQLAPAEAEYLQMTSGSTGPSKLLAITAENLITNTEGVRVALGFDHFEVGVSWLPLYHDMGLVGGELFCFIHDFPLALLSPQDFLRRPHRWFDAIDRFNGTMSITPNFGFDYCSEMIRDDVAKQYDLSSLKAILCGAEPIRLRTLQRFASRFAPYGFQPEAYIPSYGMAETTVGTTVRSPADQVTALSVDREQIAIGSDIRIKESLPVDSITIRNERTTTVLSVGRPIADNRIQIVDEVGTPQGEGVAGEIVIDGTSVALGYVNIATGNIDQFDNKIRSGDLGFFHDDQLYIVDRIKNIIIRNGVNYAASDIEEQVAHLLDISANQVAVFEDTADITTDASVVVWVDPGAGIDSNKMISALPQLYDIDPNPSRILLAKKRTIPRTSSGKKRYQECREIIQTDSLITVFDTADTSENV